MTYAVVGASNQTKSTRRVDRTNTKMTKTMLARVGIRLSYWKEREKEKKERKKEEIRERKRKHCPPIDSFTHRLNRTKEAMDPQFHCRGRPCMVRATQSLMLSLSLSLSVSLRSVLAGRSTVWPVE
mmetsp:Transcript_12911/g.25226  ORF Transcript_12911/g.25226 Transcript_12911/m.25226 type:complete len:126 (+) Transcript_12911:68-445(+)